MQGANRDMFSLLQTEDASIVCKPQIKDTQIKFQVNVGKGVLKTREEPYRQPYRRSMQAELAPEKDDGVTVSNKTDWGVTGHN